MVAEHIFAVNMTHLWKECNLKQNTLYWIYKAKYSAEGQTVCLLKWVMNLLDGSLFNSSLIFRYVETEIGYFLV